MLLGAGGLWTADQVKRTGRVLSHAASFSLSGRGLLGVLSEVVFGEAAASDLVAAPCRSVFMSDEFGWDFSGAADAKAEIRLAVEYLLAGATGTARGDIFREIIKIVRDAANRQPPDPLTSCPAASWRQALRGAERAAVRTSLGRPLVRRHHLSCGSARKIPPTSVWVNLVE
jgi:hypothetical protein